MICPKCRKPYFFLQGRSFTGTARCLRCKHEEIAEKPSYAEYHRNLYAAKKYTRNPQTDPQMKFIVEKLDIQPCEVVIDLGCGVGDYTVQIATLTANAAGYDQNAAEASKKYPDVRFFEHDLNRPIPLPDHSVDKLISINVIEHLADPVFFLKECHRVLKPGGTIALSTANLNFMFHDIHYDATHLHEWTLREWGKMMEPYFKTVCLKKDCASFNYYPLNMFFRFFLKPDLTFIGKKRFE